MALIKFYKDGNKWRIGNTNLPAGTCTAKRY